MTGTIREQETSGGRVTALAYGIDGFVKINYPSRYSTLVQEQFREQVNGAPGALTVEYIAERLPAIHFIEGQPDGPRAPRSFDLPDGAYDNLTAQRARGFSADDLGDPEPLPEGHTDIELAVTAGSGAQDPNAEASGNAAGAQAGGDPKDATATDSSSSGA
jgi:hypothetical protein